MNYAFYHNIIFQSSTNVIRFVEDETATKPTVYMNSNLRIPELHYKPKSAKWSDIPKAITYSNESDSNSHIDIVGDMRCYPAHTVNGLTFYLNTWGRGELQSYLFSLFINSDTDNIEYNEAETGGWVCVPMNYTDIEYYQRDIREAINFNSTFFHVEGNIEVANILGVDLKEKKVKTTWDNIIPYGDYPRLYLNEAEIIASFIKEMKRCYPEIEFFPQSSERENLGKETCYYRSRLVADRSARFNSNVLFNEADGRWQQTTIPIELHYQTTDIAQYSHRRSQYLLSHFFMDVHDFPVKKKRAYPDRFGNYDVEMTFSTYWERDVADELIKQDAVDGSGRDTYDLTIFCDLICHIIEQSEELVPIQDVITNIYFGTSQTEN